MKGFKLPLILILVIGGLAGLAYWDEIQTTKDKKVAEEKVRLFNFKPEEITSIEVQNPAAEPRSWTLSKEGGKWLVTAPLNYPADSEGIDRFVKTIAEGSFERVFEGKTDLKAYGLDKPTLSYVFKDASGQAQLFEVGAKSPTGYSSYIRTAQDGRVFLVSHYLVTASTKTLSDFRDRSLQLRPSVDLATFQQTGPGLEPVSLVRAETLWRLKDKTDVKLDAAATEKLLSGWQGLRVVEFMDAPGPELRKALTEIGSSTRLYLEARFGAEQGEPRDIKIVENDGKLYTRLPLGDSFAELDKAAVDALKIKPAELLDKSIFSFASVDVKGLVIDGRRYTKDGDVWTAADGTAAPAAQAAIVSLEFAKAEAKLDAKEGAALIQGPAQQTVEILQEPKPAVEFSVWPAKDSPGHLILKQGNAYFRVHDELLQALEFGKGTPDTQASGETKKDKS